MAGPKPHSQVQLATRNVQDTESLALGILGSFDSTWGVEVWTSKSISGDYKLYGNIGRLFETCIDRISKRGDEWHVRSQACTEAMAIFVFNMGADDSIIINTGKLLSDIGKYGGTREVSEIRSNKTFAIRWTCLSLLAIRKMLDSPQIQRHAHTTLRQLSALYPEGTLDFTEMTLRNAQKIDEPFVAAWNHVERLRRVLNRAEEDHLKRRRIAEILQQDGPELLSILDEVVSIGRIDASLSELRRQIYDATQHLITTLPGVAFERAEPSITTVERILDFVADPVRSQLMYFSDLLRGLCGVNEAWCSQGLQDMVETLRSMEKIPRSLSHGRLMWNDNSGAFKTSRTALLALPSNFTSFLSGNSYPHYRPDPEGFTPPFLSKRSRPSRAIGRNSQNRSGLCQ